MDVENSDYEEGQEPLIIKRYSSRRLYNTETSEYTTLEDLAEIVKTGRNVKVLDRETGEDLTKELLVRIIINNESMGLPVLPIDILMKMVRSYNEDSLSILPNFFEATYNVLNKSQSQFMKNVTDPVKGWVDFQKNQQEYLSKMFPIWQDPTKEDSAQSVEGSDTQTELENVKQKMKELQNKIDKLEREKD